MASEIVYICEQKETHYALMERNSRMGVNRRTIDGKITGCGKCVGYCSFYEHPGYLTKEIRKQHDCIKKGCYYYSPKVKEVVLVSNPFAVLLAAVSE